MKEIKEKAMLSALKDANSILLCTHINPDGDAIGSLLAMGAALKTMGKQVTMACDDAVPGNLMFLPGAEEIVGADALEGKCFDAALNIDIADSARAGACEEAFLRTPVRMQIDHHPTNPFYAQINEVDGAAPAAGNIIYRLLREVGMEITAEMATCLYCAISSDTGDFCFPSTDSETFEIMADLMRCGLKIGSVARKVHLIREVPQVKLLGRALCTLRFFCGGKGAGMRLTKEDYLSADALPEHSSGIVNYALNLPGVEMAYLADGVEDGFIRCSLRAVTGRNVSVIAKQFGGGGHVLASGCRCEMGMDEMCAAIEDAMQKQIGEKA